MADGCRRAAGWGAQGRRTSDRLRELGAKPLQLSKTNMFSSYDNMIKLETL